MKVLSYAVGLLFAFYILNPVIIGQDKADKAEKWDKAEKHGKVEAKHKERSF